MAWRLAKSLETLRAQINSIAPGRSRTSDGTKGNAAHATRKSDHNPDPDGVVRALDITHDPRHGVDTYALAEYMRQKKDPRINYVISNGRWYQAPAYRWMKYTGPNPHNLHIHFSAVRNAKADDPKEWDIKLGEADPKAPVVKDLPILRKGSRAPEVRKLQKLLKVETDGIFGKLTEKAVKDFQTTKGLVSDGIVGAYTWKALGA